MAKKNTLIPTQNSKNESRLFSMWKKALGDYSYRQYKDENSIHRLLSYTISQIYYKAKRIYKIIFFPFEYKKIKIIYNQRERGGG